MSALIVRTALDAAACNGVTAVIEREIAWQRRRVGLLIRLRSESETIVLCRLPEVLFRKVVLLL